MSTRSPETDAYIAKSAEFAQPILTKLRALFHKAEPAIEESTKWGCPFFGHDGIVGGQAAFKNHVTLTSWKGKLMGDPDGLFKDIGKTNMYALKIGSVEDLPSDEIIPQFSYTNRKEYVEWR